MTRDNFRALVLTVPFWATLAFPWPTVALQPTSQITQFGHTAWALGQHGLEGEPLTLAQTADGYIWVGTSNGLYRFDGMHFSRWSPPPGEHLPSEQIRHLLGARNGSLYIGTTFGLARLTAGHLHIYPGHLVMPGPFQEDAESNVWMGQRFDGDNTMLCKVGAREFTCFGTKDGFACRNGSSLMADHAGSIWVGSERAICHWQSGEKAQSWILPQLVASQTYFAAIFGLAKSRNGEIWAGSLGKGEGRGLLRFDGAGWKSYITPQIDGRTLSVESLLLDRDDALWIGSPEAGLSKIANGRIDHFTAADGLTGNHVRKIFEDREGVIWVGTTGGVDAFHDLSVISLGSRQGISDDSARSVALGPGGDVWIGTRNAINILHGGNIQQLTPGKGLPADDPGIVFTDSRKRTWASIGSGVFLYARGRFHPVAGARGEQVHHAVSIGEDTGGGIWVTDLDPKTRHKALLRLEGDRIAQVLPTPDNQTISLLGDARGGLWAGGYLHGLYRFQGGAYERVTLNNFDKGIVDLYEAGEDRLWFLTRNNEAWRVEKGRAQRLSPENGLACDAVFDLIDDHAGSYWFYTPCGIFRVPDIELARWWANPKYVVRTTELSLIDGARPANEYTRPQLGPDGRIWTANDSMVQIIDPKHMPWNPLPPPVRIEQIVVDRKNYRLDAPARMPPASRDFQIDYAALSYVVPEKVRFRYRLIGHDPGWTDAGTRRQAFYNDLGPGRYVFQVLACNNNGVWNNEGASLVFVIPPAWYQAWWFRSICFLGGLSLLYSFYTHRLRRYGEVMQMRFRERMDERTRIARDLHDTLLQTIQGSKMTADYGLASVNDLDAARKLLERLSAWLGRASEEGRAVLDSLRPAAPEIDDIAAAFQRTFDEYSSATAIASTVVINGKVEQMHPVARDEVYRIGDEAIRNACLHSTATCVMVEVAYNTDLTLRVSDDGCGIDADILRVGKAGHYGVPGMRERAERIGGTLNISSSPEGTEVLLRVPGRSVYFGRRTARLRDRALALLNKNIGAALRNER
jgi:hypothetical protein